MTNVLVLSGRKQSGKTTSCNFLHGYLMKQRGVTREFEINDKGDLLVFAAYNDAEGKAQTGMGVMDIMRDDFGFSSWASQNVWPHVKAFSFADHLKSAAMNIFGLMYEQCYGTDAQKNTSIDITWEDLAFLLPPRTVGELRKNEEIDRQLTAREFLQIFGTNICRKIKPNCWVEACFRDVAASSTDLAIITDARFKNEVDLSKQFGAKVVRFTRSPYEDSHSSENDLNDMPEDYYDFYLDNSEMSIKEQNDAVLAKLGEWGWIEAEVQ